MTPRDGQGGLAHIFNVRLTDEQQYDALAQAARDHHLPLSTPRRSWLLERLDQERHQLTTRSQTSRAAQIRRPDNYPYTAG